jgi:hypothetical protein
MLELVLFPCRRGMQQNSKHTTVVRSCSTEQQVLPAQRKQAQQLQPLPGFRLRWVHVAAVSVLLTIWRTPRWMRARTYQLLMWCTACCQARQLRHAYETLLA